MAAAGLAQVSANGGTTELTVGSRVYREKGGKGSWSPLTEGEKLTIDGAETTVSKVPIYAHPWSRIMFPDGSTARVSPIFTLTFDPLAVFSYAGALPGGGGTKSFTGLILAPNYAIPRGKQTSLELGGFYFLEKDRRDIYQVDVKYFVNREVGAQLAYLNLRIGNAPAFTGFLLYRLTSPANSSKNWNLLFGGGAYYNISRQISPIIGGGGNEIFPEAPLSTVNFTFFMNGSITLNKTMSLTASHWYIRDRNSELNRFALGLTFKF